jgi:hypothetical protein
MSDIANRQVDFGFDEFKTHLNVELWPEVS